MSASTDLGVGLMAAEKTASRERTFLINTTVGTDFGAGKIAVHPMLGGSRVPFGEDGCEIRVVLFDAEQHGTPRHILKGSLEVKRNKDPG